MATSRAVERCPSASRPQAFSKWVLVRPNSAARAFICCTKAGSLPPTGTVSLKLMRPADSASKASSSVITFVIEAMGRCWSAFFSYSTVPESSSMRIAAAQGTSSVSVPAGVMCGSASAAAA